MKPNPFRDPWAEVALKLKVVANVLVDFHQALRESEAYHGDYPIGDIITESFSEDEVERIYNSNAYAQALIGYVGDIYDFSADSKEYVDEEKLKEYSDNNDLGSFVNRWCLPIGELDDSDLRFFQATFIGKSIPQNASRILQMLKYEEFLKTGYWKAISRYLRDGAKCEVCGSAENLHVHHKTYEHHGFEHLYLDDLQCLCKDCHLKVHHELNKKK